MFRFTIRDVLWLMVVVGLCLALWLEHSALAQRDKRLLEQTIREEALKSDLSQVEEANAKLYAQLEDITGVKAIRDALLTKKQNAEP